MMAIPLPIPGFSATLSGYGKLFKPPRAFAAGEVSDRSVTAVIPALNEVETIPYAIASLADQTRRPDRLVVVDDGSTDGTADVVAEIGESVPFPVEVLRHDEPQGKTTGIKEVANAYDTDAVFVLDGDTYIDSDDYLERLLAAHADDDVASSFGILEPKTKAQQRRLLEESVADRFPEGSDAPARMREDVDESALEKLKYGLARWPVEQYRRLLYDVEQLFFKDAQMRLFDTTLFPIGCGVLYDRSALVEVFDDYEESLGTNLTNSEDIFFGFAFAQRGLKNVQLTDVTMRSVEPTLWELPRQAYLWSSSYLQCVYYFRNTARRIRRKSGSSGSDASSDSDGASDADERTEAPLGRTILAQLVDGLYPMVLAVTALLVFEGLLSLEWILLIVLFEFTIYSAIVLLSTRETVSTIPRLLVATPIRLLTLPVGAYTYLRVGSDIVRGNRDWKK